MLGYYDKIVAKYIPDNASRVQALQTGEIDLIYGSAELSYEDYNQATAIEGIEGKFAPSGSTIRNIILNFNGNLADLSVRQALAYAIDKGAISEGLTYGYEPVADTIVPDGTPYYILLFIGCARNDMICALDSFYSSHHCFQRKVLPKKFIVYQSICGNYIAKL